MNIFSAKDNDSDDHKTSTFGDEIDQEMLGSENSSDDGALDIDNLQAINSMFNISSFGFILKLFVDTSKSTLAKDPIHIVLSPKLLAVKR